MVTDGEMSFVILHYGDIQWWVPGTFVGFIDRSREFAIPPSAAETILDIETASNVGVPGLYIYRVDQRDIIDPRNNFRGKLFFLHACQL